MISNSKLKIKTNAKMQESPHIAAILCPVQINPTSLQMINWIII